MKEIKKRPPAGTAQKIETVPTFEIWRGVLPAVVISPVVRGADAVVVRSESTEVEGILRLRTDLENTCLRAP